MIATIATIIEVRPRERAMMSLFDTAESGNLVEGRG